MIFAPHYVGGHSKEATFLEDLTRSKSFPSPISQMLSFPCGQVASRGHLCSVTSILAMPGLYVSVSVLQCFLSHGVALISGVSSPGHTIHPLPEQMTQTPCLTSPSCACVELQGPALREVDFASPTFPVMGRASLPVASEPSFTWPLPRASVPPRLSLPSIALEIPLPLACAFSLILAIL